MTIGLSSAQLYSASLDMQVQLRLNGWIGLHRKRQDADCFIGTK